MKKVHTKELKRQSSYNGVKLKEVHLKESIESSSDGVDKTEFI